MTPTRWSRLSELFTSALELDPHQRRRLLTCEEADVRHEVERLLAEHDRTGGLLDRPLFSENQAEENLWTGQTLKERYRIERFLASGGAAAVYLAHDQQIANRPVIVKFLHAWARHYPWLKDKFRQEMEALARIDHPGVVGVLDAGETGDGLPFLVIEYIDGVTLRSEIEKGPFQIQRVSRLVQQIGRAVSAAHEKGVLHRDLKPENIMLERPGAPEETVRLIDFGIARVDTGDRETVTRMTQFAGTTPYMSPEQLAGKPLPASDTYAMGVIAYEMLSGHRPFLAGTPIELYEQQRGGVKIDPRRDRPEIPEPAVRAVLKQLSFRPEDRSPSILEAAERIAAALIGPIREPWSRRRAAGVLLSGSVAAATGAYTLRRTAGHPLDPSERVIELSMGTEPLEHGFSKDLAIDYHILPNANATGFDSMRVFTTDQGGYYHPFSATQCGVAHRNGWRLTAEAAAEDGCLYCMVDNPRDQSRYSLNLFRNQDTDTVRCVLDATRVWQGLDQPLPGPAGARHQLVLIWTPEPGQAELWVDGIKRISGYKGTRDFRYARGLVFGAFTYRSRRASGVFWKIRLEIA
jgi:serine/threonine-protein kinase